jgi:hypothetical protein
MEKLIKTFILMWFFGKEIQNYDFYVGTSFYLVKTN